MAVGLVFVAVGCSTSASPEPSDATAPGMTEVVAGSPATTTASTTSTVDPTTTTATVAPATTTSTTTTTVPAREVVHLEIRSRDSWGAKPPDRELTPHEIDQITIHHTARAHDDTPMDEKMRRWQNYHQSIGFGDIAYHMVIAADGTIYEGRDYHYVGSTRTSYDPTGHFLPALDGMFDEFWDSPNDDDDEPDGADELSDEQLGALIDLLAWASVEFDVDPSEITGHRDHAATACPGSLVYDMIHSGEIADLVRDRIESVDVELVYVSE